MSVALFEVLMVLIIKLRFPISSRVRLLPQGRKIPSISRKLKNAFSLTALGAYEGNFMKFPDGIATVKLAGGHTSHSALAGLERVNLFIDKLENLDVYNDDEDIALHVEHTDCTSNEMAVIISLAPVCQLTGSKFVIQWKGADKPIFLNIPASSVEPLQYLLLLPHRLGVRIRRRALA
ncbi:hypothetical protein DFH09DRAFT_1277308 [Mycena vulgaris]|nr:hypothetical protein DFH09DRAFT_1277308 [Mycena vulgaris]